MRFIKRWREQAFVSYLRGSVLSYLALQKKRLPSWGQIASVIELQIHSWYYVRRWLPVDWMRADFSTVTQNTRLRRQDSGMFIASPGWRPGFNIPRGLVLAHRRTSKTITECSNWGSGFCAPVFLYVLRWHLNYAINFHSVMNSRAA